MFHDLRFGVRMLRKNPGFTAVAVLSLALGIGANTAIFQLVNAVRLKTLPVRNANELVNVQLNDMDAARGSKPSAYAAVTNPIWEQIRDRQEGFSGILGDRLMATLSGFFGVLALVLATIGLYGILSYAVASRTNEIGIRLALGARTREIVKLVLREALVLVVIGIVAGIPAVLIVARFASTLLFDLSPTDPISLALAALIMMAVAILAAYLPARRATRIDPLVALRYE